jgi:hypothetical protein
VEVLLQTYIHVLSQPDNEEKEYLSKNITSVQSFAPIQDLSTCKPKAGVSRGKTFTG